MRQSKKIIFKFKFEYGMSCLNVNKINYYNKVLYQQYTYVFYITYYVRWYIFDKSFI